MNTLDLILLLPLAYFAYKGFSRGLIISLALLAGILIGFYAAIHFSDYAASMLNNHMETESDNITLIAYLLTFVVVLILVFLLGQFLTSVVKTTGLGFVNRIGGILIGIAKGLLIISAFFLLLNKIDPKSQIVSGKVKDESIFYKPLLKIVPVVYPTLKKYSDKAFEMLDPKNESSSRN